MNVCTTNCMSTGRAGCCSVPGIFRTDGDRPGWRLGEPEFPDIPFECLAGWRTMITSIHERRIEDSYPCGQRCRLCCVSPSHWPSTQEVQKQEATEHQDRPAPPEALRLVGYFLRVLCGGRFHCGSLHTAAQVATRFPHGVVVHRLFLSPDLADIPLEDCVGGWGRAGEWVDPEVHRFDHGPGLGCRTVEFHRRPDGKQVNGERDTEPKKHRGKVVCGRTGLVIGPVFCGLFRVLHGRRL